MAKNKFKIIVIGLALSPIFLAFQNFTAVNSLLGHVDGITYASDGVPLLTGWACQYGINNSIQTNIYLGGAYRQGGTYSPSLSNPGLANYPSEAAATSACGQGAYNFSIPIPASVLNASSGQSIYVYGLYPAGVQLLDGGSGQFTIPLPVIGNIDGITPNSSGGADVTGWACYAGNSASIQVSLYAGAGYPRGQVVTAVMANGPTTDPDVINACGSAGNYNFSIAVSAEQLVQFAGQGIYINGISPMGGTNPLLNNSGKWVFPSSPFTPCSVSDVASLNACAASSSQVIEFTKDVTCTGSSCCSSLNANPTLNLSNQQYRVVNGQGHTLHRLADPTTGVGYQFQCPAIGIANSSYIKIESLNIDEDETVPACTIAVDGTGVCSPTVSVMNSYNVDFENVAIYNGKSYVVNVTGSYAVTFNNSVISNAGIIGFYAGNLDLGLTSEYVFLTNSVIARSSTNAVAFLGVNGLYYGANAIEGNIFNSNHHRGAWQAGGGSLITGGQLYLPNVNFLNVDNNVIADGACTSCPANNGEVWGFELGYPLNTPAPVVNFLQVWGNYLYNGFGLPYLLNTGAQFGGASVLGGYVLSSQPADTIAGFSGNPGNYSSLPNFANFSQTTAQVYSSTGQPSNYSITGAGASLAVNDSVSNATATLNRSGVSDYSIYRLRILSSGMHEEANTPGEFGNGAVLEQMFGLSPSPRLGAASYPIYRCFMNGNSQADFASLDPNCGGTQRSFHSILGYSYESSYPGAQPFYSCSNNGLANDLFVSWASNCEGQKLIGPLGYAVTYRYLSPINSYVQGVNIETNRPNTTGISGLSYRISPALPSGLSLDANSGLITGTPNVPLNPTNFTVVVTGALPNGSPSSVSLPLTISVKAALAYTNPVAVYSKGLPIATNALASPSSAAFYQGGFSVSPALPAGLTLNSTTGAISGTPTSVIPYSSYTVTAIGQVGSSTSLLVFNPPLFYSSSTSNYTVGAPINSNLPSSVSAAVFTNYSISPALPPGLSFNVKTGAITGTPSSASSQTSYQVTGYGANGYVSSQNLNITVSN